MRVMAVAVKGAVVVGDDAGAAAVVEAVARRCVGGRRRQFCDQPRDRRKKCGKVT